MDSKIEVFCLIDASYRNRLVVKSFVSEERLVLKKGFKIIIYHDMSDVVLALSVRGCQIYGFVGGLTGTTSIMSMAILAGNRYRVISKPFDPDRKSTKIQSMVQILFIWLYALCFASLPLFGISRYVPEGYLTSCSFEYLSDNVKDRIFILIFFIGAWCVPFSLISFSYINIISVIRRSDFKVSENVDDNIYRKKTEMKITKTIFILIGLWMIAWTPYAIVALLGISGNKEYVTPFSSMLPGVFCKLSACANPFLYALSHPGMKKEIINIISNFCLNSSAEAIHLDFIKGKTNDSSSESNSPSPSKEKADLTQDRINKNANEIHPIKNSRIS
ncbi:opsin, ultraviolet-sensitive-like [Artemia franciscana]|uniref:opsin, ultraviolet-sensitive-like n=1 Tax=Artemia franciscana TaxID=6661 RepID=UPI0032DB4502